MFFSLGCLVARSTNNLVVFASAKNGRGQKGRFLNFPEVGTGPKSCAHPNNFTYMRTMKIASRPQARVKIP